MASSKSVERSVYRKILLADIGTPFVMLQHSTCRVQIRLSIIFQGAESPQLKWKSARLLSHVMHALH